MMTTTKLFLASAMLALTTAPAFGQGVIVQQKPDAAVDDQGQRDADDDGRDGHDAEPRPERRPVLRRKQFSVGGLRAVRI